MSADQEMLKFKRGMERALFDRKGQGRSELKRRMKGTKKRDQTKNTDAKRRETRGMKIFSNGKKRD